MVRVPWATALVPCAALACSAGPLAPPPPPPPPPVSQLVIDPPYLALTAGGAVQFNAFGKNGDPVAVSWSLSPTTGGSITTDGRFTHAYCSSGTVWVRARLLADPSVSTTAAVQIAYSEPAFTALRSVQLSNGQPASLDSLAGTVRVVASIAAQPFPCRTVNRLRLLTTIGLDSQAVDSAVFVSPLTASEDHTFSWSTTTVPNGAHWIYLVATRLDGSTDASPGIAVQVRNP